jgi:NRPS condensation-like uncharacterized protein
VNRPLGTFETAQVMTGNYAPFNLVLVLRLDRRPGEDTLQRSLEGLVRRHSLLRARIRQRRARFFFDIADHIALPLHTLARRSDDHWRAVAEEQLNAGFDLAEGPLFRLTSLTATSADSPCELVLTAHHVIIDGVSAARLLHDLLSNCAALASGEQPAVPTAYPPPNPAETLLPKQFRGWRRAGRLIAFAGRQAWAELRCAGVNRGVPALPARPPTHCRIMPFRLSSDATRAMLAACKRRGVTVAGLLCAAQLLTARAHGFGDSVVLFRHFMFADLRPYLQPTLAADQLGNYIAMVQLHTRVGLESEPWTLARTVSVQMHDAAKRGDKFLSLFVSKPLMRAILRLQRPRMGHAALSFSGGVPLAQRYGDIEFRGLHAFVSNLALGPVYTANVRIFQKQLCWDMVYLDNDLSSAQAAEIADGVRHVLRAAADD